MTENTQSTSKTVQPELKRLSDMLLELDDMLVSCMRCGFCMAVCPVYGATMQEADVTRGKITLLENLAKHMIDDPEAVNDKLNRCLLCGSCQAACPSGVKIMDIFLRARSIVAGYMGLSPVKKIIFRSLLVRPKLFNSLIGMSSKFQGLFLKEASGSLGTSCAPLLSPLIGSRHFPSLAKQSFHSKIPSLDTSPGRSGLKVAFFPGCVSDKLFPNVAQAAIKVFEKHGVGVFMPPDQACCGVPALASGDRQSYDKLVAQNLKLFGDASFDYLITPCATCTSTIKEFWPKLMEGYSTREQEQIRTLHDKAIDLIAFLVDVLKVELPQTDGQGRRVTYHDSCHLKKSLGVAEQPRKVLKGLPGYAYVEMPEADRCCGSGGSFTLSHFDLSTQIGQRKRNNIVSVKPEVVAAACPACMMQLMDMLSRNKDEVRVKHVVELYLEAVESGAVKP